MHGSAALRTATLVRLWRVEGMPEDTHPGRPTRYPCGVAVSESVAGVAKPPLKCPICRTCRELSVSRECVPADRTPAAACICPVDGGRL